MKKEINIISLSKLYKKIKSSFLVSEASKRVFQYSICILISQIMIVLLYWFGLIDIENLVVYLWLSYLALLSWVYFIKNL